MSGFVKKSFAVITTFFNLSYLNSLECVSTSNQECEARPKVIGVNINEPVFYPYSIKVNKCRGSCGSISNPYAKLCVPDIFKKINVKVFNLMSKINETRQIIWHEACKCICRLSAAICNSKQIWNGDKCRCECKELAEKGTCGKRFIWNPSNCAIGEYLDYKNCVCRKCICNSIKCEKDPMKIKCDAYDEDLPLNKILRFFDLNIIVESVFQINDKHYPQIHIHE